jgi:hypothetical protein
LTKGSLSSISGAVEPLDDLLGGLLLPRLLRPVADEQVVDRFLPRQLQLGRPLDTGQPRGRRLRVPLHQHLRRRLRHEHLEHRALALERRGVRERLGRLERIGHRLQLGLRGRIRLGDSEVDHGQECGERSADQHETSD